VRTIFVVSLSLALGGFGCKDKPTKKAPPPNVGSAADSTGSNARPAPDLVLPRADGTPPKKTTKPLTKEDFERLSKLEYPGFTKEVRSLGTNAVELRYKTKDHPKLWAVVTVKNCFDCLPMELDKWKAKEQELRASTLESLKDSKDVEWELGETQLNGQKLISIYQIGTNSTPGQGGESYAFTNTYIAHYNDGVNEIRTIGAYKDDPVALADLKRLAPKDDLRALALSFLDVFSHEW
jgi:hypothetical protein